MRRPRFSYYLGAVFLYILSLFFIFILPIFFPQILKEEDISIAASIGIGVFSFFVGFINHAIAKDDRENEEEIEDVEEQIDKK